jgi:hypothetical protein
MTARVRFELASSMATRHDARAMGLASTPYRDSDAEPGRIPWRRIARVARRLAVGVLPLVLIEGYALQQGMIALICAVVVVVRVFNPARSGQEGFWRRRWKAFKDTSPLALGVAITFGILIGNPIVARRRAQAVIVAVDRYRVANGRYPASLDVLVPEYLPNLPNARFGLFAREFMYIAEPEGDDASVGWVVIPPFNRRFYRFRERRWGHLD